MKKRNVNQINNTINWGKYYIPKKLLHDWAECHINLSPKQKIDQHHYSNEYVISHFREPIINHIANGTCNKSSLNIPDLLETINSNSSDTDFICYLNLTEKEYYTLIENTKKIDDKSIDLYCNTLLFANLLDLNKKHSIKVRLFVPKDVKVIYLSDCDYNKDAYEVVLEPNLKFKIINSTGTYIDCLIVK